MSLRMSFTDLGIQNISYYTVESYKEPLVILKRFTVPSKWN